MKEASDGGRGPRRRWGLGATREEVGAGGHQGRRASASQGRVQQAQGWPLAGSPRPQAPEPGCWAEAPSGWQGSWLKSSSAYDLGLGSPSSKPTSLAGALHGAAWLRPPPHFRASRLLRAGSSAVTTDGGGLPWGATGLEPQPGVGEGRGPC